MKEIGGYFELDPGGGNTPLPNGVLLNSGRNALRHIVRQLRVKSIWVPEYTCPVVWDALKAEHCGLKFYSIGLDLFPVEKLPQNDFILYTNYFGCCGKNVEQLAAEHPNLIVDCAQAYHAKPKGRASFSSPRKFFGVADGGIAFGVEGAAYPQDDSSARQQHLIVRKEKGASVGYPLFQAAEESLIDAPVRMMSAVTTAALQKFDAATVIQKRCENFAFLHERIQSSFPFALADDDVPMVYPYVTDDSTLRSRLIAQKIYVAKYWPGLSSATNALAERIVPLPIVRDNVRYYSLCREIFALLARRFANSNRRVLLPAYTCDTVFNPFLLNGWRCEFFGITKELQINIDSLVNVCNKFNPDLVIVHPYYGMGLTGWELDALASLRRSGRVIVEDLTQCLFSDAVDDVFDFFVGSMRKWMAMPDGAFVTSAVYELDDFPIPTSENSLYLETQLAAMRLRGDYYASNRLSIKDESRMLAAKADSLIESTVEPHVMSAFSRGVFAHANQQVIRQKRLDNVNYLIANLNPSANIMTVDKIHSMTTAPLYYPILVSNRSQLISRLIPERIYTPILWPVTNSSVLVDEDVRWIYDSILAVPVDQRYGVDDIARVCDIINRN